MTQFINDLSNPNPIQSNQFSNFNFFHDKRSHRLIKNPGVQTTRAIPQTSYARVDIQALAANSEEQAKNHQQVPCF